MRALARYALPFAALALVLALFPLVAPLAAIDVGVYALIYGLAAIGLSLLMGLAGQVSLGHAAFFAVGAYSQALLVTKAGWSIPVAALVAVIASMVTALIIGLPLLRLRGHFLALATLGLGIIVTVTVTELEITGATSGIFGIPRAELFGRTYDTAEEFFWLMTPVVVLGLIAAVNIVHSRIGRALLAVKDSEVASECLGVNTFVLRLGVFVLSAAYAGLAGAFYAHWLTIVNPSSAKFELSVLMLLMVVLGGLGTVWGAIFGAIAVQTLDEGLRAVIPVFIPNAKGEVQLIGYGVVLVLVIILLPGGLAQLWGRLWSRLRPRSAGATDTPSADETAPGAALKARENLDQALQLLSRADYQPRGTPILTVRDLTKRYGGVVALDSLDVDVNAGEILALIGPNGAGKTTAFNMITGVMAPTNGSVVLHGTEVAGSAPHVAAGLGATRTFQNLQTFKSTTVLGNVKVARHLRSKAGLLRGMVRADRAEERDIEAAARAAIHAMGLTKLADRPVADLAFGQQRQVEVARALAMEPSVLLLDEPMAGLSGPERDSLSLLLRNVSHAGVAVMLVEHDVAAVMALADRVAVLDDGVLLALGTPEQVSNNPAVIAAYLGTDEEAERLLEQAAADTQAVEAGR
ncbi:MAG TPA: branched-chain amino acid ABC transporter ATP-binding protein/permease [Dermatophilaceae bacterium]|nr:branched-chain amino acid ABC transporter ATP-binding protein/permease [Dermatophilaceae bacterium]